MRDSEYNANLYMSGDVHAVRGRNIVEIVAGGSPSGDAAADGLRGQLPGRCKSDPLTLPLTASPAALAEVVLGMNQTMSGSVDGHAALRSERALGRSPHGDSCTRPANLVAGVESGPLPSVTLPEPGARCAYHERVAQEQYARAKAYVERMDRALREREARIDRGEECPKCKGRDIERQEFCGVFVCRQCRPETSWFDVRGAE